MGWYTVASEKFFDDCASSEEGARTKRMAARTHAPELVAERHWPPLFCQRSQGRVIAMKSDNELTHKSTHRPRKKDTVMKLIVLSSLIGATCAFAPAAPSGVTPSSLRSSTDTNEETTTINGDEPETTFSILSEEEPKSTADFKPWEVNAYGQTASSADAINGWTPDATLPCFGLPGALAPTGYFDPLGFCQNGISLNDVKRYREAEVQHGRVAMLAAVGYLAGEAFPSPFGITGPANDQLQQVPLPAFILLTVGIAAAELKRATIGWVEPSYKPGSRTLWTLRDTYYPGDLGFDPLGFKPTDPKAFADMQTRELQNGRLAMLGVFGMCAQELVNHKTIMATVDFYQKVYSGINPYETY